MALFQDIFSQPLPVMIRVSKSLCLRCKVLSSFAGQSAFELSDGCPFFEGIDVRN